MAKHKLIYEIVFNEHKMLKRLSTFDYIKEKYGISDDDVRYLEFMQAEENQQQVDVVKRDYSYIYDNIRLVYGDDFKAQHMMNIYRIVKEEIINKFLSIPGLERMYDEHFFEFEWDMHSRLDFDEHNISFYRDHFVHQVRNLYEMLELIDSEKSFRQEKDNEKKDDEKKDDKEIGFYEDFKKWFVYGDSKVSLYVQRVLDHIVQQQTNSPFRKFTNKKEIYEAYTEYIIKASIALSALFHDIGYPILHFEKLRKRIAAFMPSMYMFTGGEGNQFERIYAQLYNSFLFRIVDKEELREQVCGGDNHGAVSAIAFLLTFYQSGAIYSIPEEKKLAIELAALAIYNHTIQYISLRKDEDKQKEPGDYYRPVYRVNPLSYLLRICDDMQEWERTYFEIQEMPEFMVCPKCGNTFTHNKKQYFKRLLPSVYEYKCLCGKARRMDCTDNYARRKIVDIINCKEASISFYEKSGDSKGKYMEIHLDYDLALLLRMCSVAPDFCKHRLKDLKKIKIILSAQPYGGFDETIVTFLLSPNPFILKAAIIGEALNTDDSLIKQAIKSLRNPEKFNMELRDKHLELDREDMKRLLVFLKDFRKAFNNISKAITYIDGKGLSDKEWEYDNTRQSIALLEDLKEKLNTFMSKYYKNYLSEAKRLDNICFYYLLYIISNMFIAENTAKYESNSGSGGFNDIYNLHKASDDVCNKLIDYAKKICGDVVLTQDMELFIKDAVKQYKKMFDDRDTSYQRTNCKSYYDVCLTEDDVYDAVAHYCYSENVINKQPYPLNYYSDFSIFEKLHNACILVKHIKNIGADLD